MVTLLLMPYSVLSSRRRASSDRLVCSSLANNSSRSLRMRVSASACSMALIIVLTSNGLGT